jgi:dTDP-4-amino-4,6-dideoxygalactose transaminase
VAYRGFYLPSGAALKDDELDYVADNLREVLDTL